MPRRITLSVVSLLTLCFAFSASAQAPAAVAKKEAAAPSADEKKIVVESFSKRYAALGSWEATFMQIEKSPGLSQELSSEGEFRFVTPNKFMLESKGSISKKFVSNGERAWYLEDNPKSKERYFVRSFKDAKSLELERFLVFFRGLKKGKSVAEDFEINGTFNKPHLEVTLIPKKESDFAEIKILFHNSETYPKRLSFIDAVGGETVLNIISARKIRKVDPKWFDFEIPKGARVEK